MPNAVAAIAVDAGDRVQKWTFVEVATAARRLATILHNAGLCPGDRVLLLMPRVPYWQVAMTACMQIGLIPIPCVTQITEKDIVYRANQSGARGVITSAGHTEKFATIGTSLVIKASLGGGKGWVDLEEALAAAGECQHVAEMTADTPALMYFTSGSSGFPKAVVHAARGVYVRSWQPWRQLRVKPGETIWATSDTGWTRFGSCLLFGAWMHGATAFMYEGPLEPAARLALLNRFEINYFCAVATELRRLLSASGQWRFPKLSVTFSAGEAVTAELLRRWREFSGAPVRVGYGQTETPTSTLTDEDVLPANGLIGRPMAGNHIAIINEEGCEVETGKDGEIAFAADDPGLMLGYWRKGQIDSGKRITANGKSWYVTGDHGYCDEIGNFHFIGRGDDIISSAGYRIGPIEVENVLLQHPAVIDCAVAASPDPARGEVVKAFVILTPGVTPSEQLAAALQDHVKKLTAPYKCPRCIEFVRHLPRTGSGKLARRELREAEFAKLSKHSSGTKSPASRGS
ncbi:MAG: AMP-binding protein [Betaproteobacteria bacterium]|nr:AMP-binding protein [Betaproteobacteria bacterium]